jgi:hypothetical protein
VSARGFGFVRVLDRTGVLGRIKPSAGFAGVPLRGAYLRSFDIALGRQMDHVTGTLVRLVDGPA